MKRLALFLGAAAAVWGLAFLGELSLLMPLTTIVFFAAFIGRGRYIEAALLLVFQPLSVSLAVGCMHYAQGEATIRHAGLIDFNLDRQTRCFRSTYGCWLRGNEWVFSAPYNAAVRWLVDNLGFTANAYTGPYPDEEQARLCMLNAEPVPDGDLIAGVITLGGETIRLADGVGQRIAETSEYGRVLDRGSPRQVIGALFEEECIVLRIPAVPDDDVDPASAAVLVLLRRDQGRPFACYGNGRGSSIHANLIMGPTRIENF